MYNKDIEQIKKNLEIIKSILLPKVDDEGELSVFAKNELKISRESSDCEYVTLDDLKKRIKIKNKFYNHI
jgi:hypothetical protein